MSTTLLPLLSSPVKTARFRFVEPGHERRGARKKLALTHTLRANKRCIHPLSPFLCGLCFSNLQPRNALLPLKQSVTFPITLSFLRICITRYDILDGQIQQNFFFSQICEIARHDFEEKSERFDGVKTKIYRRIYY